MFKTQTLRFDVLLDTNNPENYEISLLDLIKKDKPLIQNADNKDEIMNIENLVKAMEAKYGPVAVVKGKRIRVNDFVDQGNGYDADDPFIDDSGEDEALIVAPDLMTEHGGFFINIESLKLSESNFVIDRVEGVNDSMICPKKPFTPKSINKKTKSQQLLSQARKRLTTSSKANSVRRIVTNADKQLEEIINDVVTTNKAHEVEKIESAMKPTKKCELNEVAVPNVTQGKEAPAPLVNNTTSVPQTKLELPTGLPDATLEKVRTLMEISEQCKSEGTKVGSQFNIVLIELDTMLCVHQKDAKGVRRQVLQYISETLDIKYDYILRKICKIKDSKKKQKMMPLFTALEDAINEAMVESIAKYEADMEQYSMRVVAQRSSIASIASDTQSSVDISSNGDVEVKVKSNKIKQPKRTFKWTLACKSLLFKLACGSLDSFRTANSKGTPEEHLTKFYQTNVIVLFKPRWMTVCQLMKASMPLVTEFKQCTANGKEFKALSPAVKRKAESKPHPNLTEIPATQLKEPVLTLFKCSTTNDTNCGKGKTLPPATKEPLPQLKTATYTGTTNGVVKPQLIVNSFNKSAKMIKPSLHKTNTFSKHSVRSSSIIPESRFNNIASTMTVNPLQGTKRLSNGTLVACHVSPKQVSPNQARESHEFKLIGLPHDYIDPKQLCRPSMSNTSPVKHIDPHSSQQQQQQQQNHIHQRILSNDFVHSTPCNTLQEYMPRNHNRPQVVPDLSTIFSSPIKRIQSMGLSHAITKPRNMDDRSSMQQAHHSYNDLLKELADSSNKAAYVAHPLASVAMIDLTQDSSPTERPQQISPSMYVNMNAAHCANGRNFQK